MFFLSLGTISLSISHRLLDDGVMNLERIKIISYEMAMLHFHIV